jgi:hypothetical protein
MAVQPPAEEPAARQPSSSPADQSANPYAAPAEAAAEPAGGTSYDPASLRKIEAVIKDAGQVWLAVLMGFLCTAFTWVLIGPWFLYRLHCWNRLSRQHPELLAADAVPGGLEAKFQKARGKLITGLVIGAVMLLLILLAIGAQVVA